MAKTKNKKKNQSDNIQTKKTKSKTATKTMSPFEVHINNEKIRVLGKKAKNDRGLPGISRAKALNKRKQTLLKEYEVQNKSNKFVDRRIGEKNTLMNFEERQMARYAAVRIKQHNKKSLFNLADDEILTHRGQTLSEIEKFDDPRSDDEHSDDENKSGKLERSFVEDAHFGGGLLQRTGKDGAKTHRELIDQLISESKKRKAEQQKTKEATLELTEKLDTEWKDLLPLVNKSKKDDDAAHKPNMDDYDKVMRELRFESRGTVSDRLKSEEEIAKDEKEKLEQLENERIERMKGIVKENKPTPKHRSADDLDDDFVYESDPEYMLSYNDEGTSNVKVDANINGKILNDQDADNQEEDEENQQDEAEDEESEQETESEDDLSDLKAETSDSDEEINEIKESEQPTPTENKRKSTDALEASNKKQKTTTDATVPVPVHQECDTTENIKKDLLQRKEMMEQARAELPFTYSLPDSYETLQNLLTDKTSIQKGIIVERIIKCNHSSLAEGNKDNLGLLFAYLLQYLNDTGSDVTDKDSIKDCFDVFAALAPHLFELAQMNNVNSHNSVVEVIKEKHMDYRENLKKFPSLENLLFLKLVSLLFSTSDFRHQIVTSCFVFMEQILTRCKVKNRADVSFGIFVSTLVLEYTTLSKRFMPAVVNFLGGILHMAVPKIGVKIIKVLPPFNPINSDLVLIENYKNQKLKSYKLDATDLIEHKIDDEYKIRTLSTCVKLLGEFVENFKSLPCNLEIFQNVLKYLELINIENYPEVVQNDVKNLISVLTNQKAERKLKYIVMEAQKPKALRLYEPKIEAVYDGKKFKKQSKEKSMRDKLLHKIKKEKKGALREIRRDNAFLGRVKIRQQIRSDQERKDKVKKLMAEASVQQSELNTLDRTNNPKKRK